jgi:hypothetical protein
MTVLKRLAQCPQRFTLSITAEIVSVVTEICEISIELARAWSTRLPARGVGSLLFWDSVFRTASLLGLCCPGLPYSLVWLSVKGARIARFWLCAKRNLSVIAWFRQLSLPIRGRRAGEAGSQCRGAPCVSPTPKACPFYLPR